VSRRPTPGGPDLELSGVTTLLCDADGTLFPSEEPAYAASAVVTQDFAARFGLPGDFSGEHLRRTGTGRNFRTLTADLLAEAHLAADSDELERWIERERVEVTEHLAATLQPDADVRAVTAELSGRYRLAVVSSSATPRLLACLRATGLDTLFDPAKVFSAEDSMARPIGKPDPAVYRHALAALGVGADATIALEDSPTGVRSAVGAGIRTVGVVRFVPEDERDQRVRELHAAGALVVVAGWRELADVLLPEEAAA
jgi:HAD superfamily hydrolase (TIGR01509 family)